MKVTLNLATASSARVRYGLSWAIPTAVVGLAFLVVLCVMAVGNFRAYRRVSRSGAEERAEEAGMREKEAALRRELERPQLREIYRQTGFINGVIDRRRFALTDLVDKVTKLLPANVRLDGLSLTNVGKDRILRLAVAAQSEEEIEKFLVNLEDSPDFTEVTILNQGLAQKGDEEEPATVACSARYVGGPAEEGARKR